MKSSSIWPVYVDKIYVVGVIIKHNSLKLLFLRHHGGTLYTWSDIFMILFMHQHIHVPYIWINLLTLNFYYFHFRQCFQVFSHEFLWFLSFCCFGTYDFIFMIMVYSISIKIKCLYWTTSSSSSCPVLNFLIASLEYFVYKCVII